MVTRVNNCSLSRNSASSIGAQLMGACVRPLLFRIAKRTRIARTLQTRSGNRVARGVMSKRNWRMRALLGNIARLVFFVTMQDCVFEFVFDQL